MPNGTTEVREYDELNRLVFLENVDSTGRVISSYRYTLNQIGNRVSVEEHNGRKVEYVYDDLDKLIKESVFENGESIPRRTVEYTYDPVGNRLSRMDSLEGTTTYIYDDNDRLVSETTNGITTNYTYDNNGNLLSRISDVDKKYYQWDFENRLIGVDRDGNNTPDVQFQYDAAFGDRVSQMIDGVETRFLVDTNRAYTQVLEEYTPNNVTTASYVYGNGLISQNKSELVSFYHVDGLGSTSIITN